MRKVKGVTLIEVLVTVSILTVVFAVTFGALRVYDMSLTMANTKSQLSAQANSALNRMREELSLSSVGMILEIRADDPAPAESIRFRVPLPALDTSQNLQWGDGVTLDNQAKYYLGAETKPSQLIKEKLNNLGDPLSPAEKAVLANDINDLEFTLSGNSLEITVTAAKGVQRGIIPGINNVSATGKVDFRN